eukprot:s7021_g1.t1
MRAEEAGGVQLQQLSAQQFNLGYNLNVRIQDLEDSLQERSDRHEQDIQNLASGLLHFRQLLACFALIKAGGPVGAEACELAALVEVGTLAMSTRPSESACRRLRICSGLSSRTCSLSVLAGWLSKNCQALAAMMSQGERLRGSASVGLAWRGKLQRWKGDKQGAGGAPKSPQAVQACKR